MFTQTFTAVRADPPHWPTVLNTLRQTDPTVGYASVGDKMVARLDKDTDWTAQQITQTQNVINNAVSDTAQIQAQFVIDAMPIATKALLLALIDQLNVIRAALPTPLAAITPAQAIAAVRNKAGTL